MRRAFTMVELLVVMAIISLLSVVFLPTVINEMRAREVDAAARIVQSALVNARDAATLARAPAGFRLVPDPMFPPSRLVNGQVDPSQPLAAMALMPLETGPDYSEGLVNTYRQDVYSVAVTGGLPVLILEEAPGYWQETGGGWAWIPNEPTSWAWNIRVGERVKINSGHVFTVCGPMVVKPSDGNSEQFVNYGKPEDKPSLVRTYVAPDGKTTHTDTPEYLWLVNGVDDNNDGFVDSGWDGLDNDGINGIDDAGEWEAETWVGSAASDIWQGQYVIHRRPTPSQNTKVVQLPAGTVIDLTTWATTRERSRVYVNPWTGTADVLLDPSGRVYIDLPYSSPSSISLQQNILVFWICGRAAVSAPAPSPSRWFQLPMPSDTPNYPSGMPTLADEHRIVVVRGSGGISSITPDTFDAINPRPTAPYQSVLAAQ